MQYSIKPRDLIYVRWAMKVAETAKTKEADTAKSNGGLVG
jgi:hypothetical protein